MKVFHKEPQKTETELSNHKDFCCNTTMRKTGMETVLEICPPLRRKGKEHDPIWHYESCWVNYHLPKQRMKAGRAFLWWQPLPSSKLCIFPRLKTILPWQIQSVILRHTLWSKAPIFEDTQGKKRWTAVGHYSNIYSMAWSVLKWHCWPEVTSRSSGIWVFPQWLCAVKC